MEEKRPRGYNSLGEGGEKGGERREERRWIDKEEREGRREMKWGGERREGRSGKKNRDECIREVRDEWESKRE